jgi:hypothetical protein
MSLVHNIPVTLGVLADMPCPNSSEISLHFAPRASIAETLSHSDRDSDRHSVLADMPYPTGAHPLDTGIKHGPEPAPLFNTKRLTALSNALRRLLPAVKWVVARILVRVVVTGTLAFGNILFKKKGY